MKRISSSLVVWWYKRIGLWLLGASALLATGIILFFVLRGLLEPAWLLAPFVLTVAGAAYVRKFVLPLADGVFDDGNALVARRGTESVRIAFPDIKRVDYSLVFDPPRITLQTRQTGPIAFTPCFTPAMCFFRTHPLVAELSKRCTGSPPS